jgi:hypothetical protein
VAWPLALRHVVHPPLERTGFAPARFGVEELLGRGRSTCRHTGKQLIEPLSGKSARITGGAVKGHAPQLTRRSSIIPHVFSSSVHRNTREAAAFLVSRSEARSDVQICERLPHRALTDAP